MKTQVTKVAVRREQGVPVGQPARLYIVCPFDAVQTTLDPQHGATCPNCGRIFDSRGWIIGQKPVSPSGEAHNTAKQPAGRFRIEYTADPRENEGFDSYAKMLWRAHDLIHAGAAFVRVFDSGMLLGVLTHKDFRGRCPKCDPALAGNLT